MQTPITLQNPIFPIKTIQEFRGSLVPFEVASYQEDFESSKKGGFFDLTDWGVIEISGVDATDYLQRMSTANIKKLAREESVEGAFLTGKGTIISLGTFLKKQDDCYWFCVSPDQTEKTLQHLEQFHFQEKLEIKDKTQELAVLGLWNPPGDYHQVVVQRKEAEKTFQDLKRQGLSFLGMHLYHFLRVQRGLPWVGWEVSDADLILEASLDQAVARNKGCYPGQEVVERIFTYGQVNRKLLRVELYLKEPGVLPVTPQEFKKGSESVGKLMSAIQCPEDVQKSVGLAFVKKGFWESKESFSLDSGIKLKLC